MERNRVTLLLLATAMATATFAQSEGGLLLGAEAEKKVNKQLSVGLTADFRTRNDFKTIDRWSVGLMADYKLTKWLKADAGYKLLDCNFREKVENYTSQAGNAKMKWRPSYWGLRHRFHLSLTASHKFANNIKLSWRERWQYTYRPEATPDRYKLKLSDQTMTLDDDYVRDAKSKHQLRTRFQVSYDKKKALLTPFANVEFYNTLGIEKIRYTVGTEVRLAKQHGLELFYRFQDMKHVSEGEYDPDMHYVGMTYKLEL